MPPNKKRFRPSIRTKSADVISVAIFLFIGILSYAILYLFGKLDLGYIANLSVEALSVALTIIIIDNLRQAEDNERSDFLHDRIDELEDQLEKILKALPPLPEAVQPSSTPILTNQADTSSDI